MYTHNLDPILFDFGFLAIRWYSLAYIGGILIGWWLGKKIITRKFQNERHQLSLKNFDDFITYIIISIIIGGRLGYVVFYNLSYYASKPLDIIKIWNFLNYPWLEINEIYQLLIYDRFVWPFTLFCKLF